MAWALAKQHQAAARTKARKNRQGACFFKVQFVPLAIVNPHPMIKLPSKTVDVQSQSRQPYFQNLSIRKFDGLMRLLVVCI